MFRLLCLILLLFVGSAPAYAQGKYEIFPRDPKGSPVTKSCSYSCTSFCTCRPVIEENHIEIRAHVTDEFIKHRDWMIDEFFVKHILPAMAMMTDQLQAVGMAHTFSIGGFFDAKNQLETQRSIQRMMAEAHKDYQPSKGICTVGTNVRSLANSQRRSYLGKDAFASQMLNRQLQNGDLLSAMSLTSDRDSRMDIFKKQHCTTKDNGRGLQRLCGSDGPKERINKDVDFTRGFESKLTLDVNFLEDPENPGEDAQDLFAMSNNLFASSLPSAIDRKILANEDGKPRTEAIRYLDLRSVAAKRSVAQNAMASIMAERMSGDEETAKFLKRIVTEMGVSDEDAEKLLGEKPSYFAQMEVLTKDIYQNPKFYTELYDKPANVLRKGATIRALNLMQDRDLFESQLRTEAVLSVLLETMLHEEHNKVYSSFDKLGGDSD